MKAVALALLLAAPAFAAEPPKPRVFPGLVVNLKTKDGWALKAKYNPPREGMMSFVLLHGAGGRKEDWYRLSRPLFKRGCGYLAVDLRGHGESQVAPDGKPAVYRKFVVTKGYNEYLNMSADIEAAVGYLESQGVSDEDIALIGADVGGSLALRYGALHPKIAMVVLLSPGMKYQEVTTVNAMRIYKDRPILMVYSEADRTSARETPVLYAFAKMSVGERRATLLVAPTEHGTKMLSAPVVAKILDWTRHPVQDETAVSTPPVTGVEASTETAGDEAPSPEAGP